MVETDISRHIWATKYRYVGDDFQEVSVEDTWRRVAAALAAVEPEDKPAWRERFNDLLENFRFVPGGRIQAGAGTGRRVTLFNCFVMGMIEDSIPGIFQGLQEGAVTMQQGGGVGYDFSTLRPSGTRARGSGAIASGPVSFMEIWDAMCGAILSTGARRGAMMATLRCDHPDIERFVMAKQTPSRLTRFNLSVLITDAFMTAVRADEDWPLMFPEAGQDGEDETVLREWSGRKEAVPCRVFRHIRARALWDLILRSTYDFAEPGVLFLDRINQLNNLWYRERISATNPCGEIPLPPYGACDLGSLNLTRFVDEPLSSRAKINFEALAQATSLAVRMLDDVIDASGFPLPEQAATARGSRRIGLGITGLADAFLMLGLTYGDDGSIAVAKETMRTIRDAAYRSSIVLAKEKGAFPWLDRDRYLEGLFVRRLPDDIRDGIAKFGVRNSHLLAIAPAGTISLLAGNVSSGIEPIFAASYSRRVLAEDGSSKEFALTDYALELWRREKKAKAGAPPGFTTAAELPFAAHLAVQAALQPFVDHSISKTIHVPNECPFSEFRKVYDLAYDAGLKGCTTFRPNPVSGAVLEPSAEARHCCAPERETD